MPQRRGFEGRNWPDVVKLGEYEDNFSGRHRSSRVKFSQAQGEIVRSRSATELIGPGSYRTERQFPGDAKKEACAPQSANLSLSCAFGTETRMCRDGCLKGQSPRAGGKLPNPMGPGSYDAVPAAMTRSASASFSFPRCRISPDEVRAAKLNHGVPGPGAYPFKSPLAEAGEVLSDSQSGQPKRTKRRHQAQWGQIFAATKPPQPRRQPLPAASPLAAATGPGAAASTAAAAAHSASSSQLSEKDCLSLYLSFGR